jgi:hypothetical protein
LNFSHELLPAITYLSILAGYILILHLIRTCYRLKKRHSPLGDIVFRSPGQSLIKKIDDLTQDIGLNMALFISVPLVLYANHISHLYYYQEALNIWIVSLLGGIGTAVTFNYLIKTLKLLKKRRFIRLEYENTLAVGQELNRLMLEGYHVYHEIPADRFNIDHLVIGHSGIFAVATSARPNFKFGNDLQAATVEYNGKMLIFPDGDDYRIIEHAERQAFWLSEWIGNATGEPVAARAIVALPGWVVKRTSADGISVVNPEQFSSLFKHIKPRTLSDDLISRIVHQLEQMCHDAVPTTQEYDIQATIEQGGHAEWLKNAVCYMKRQLRN